MTTLDNPNFGNEMPPYRDIALRYGVIGSLLLIAVGLVFQLAGLIDLENRWAPMNIVSNLLTYGIMIGVIVMAIRQHRDEDLRGFISFGRAFGLGFLTIVIIGLIQAIWTYVYFGFIDPSMLDQIREMSYAAMEEQGMTDEQIEASQGMMNLFQSPWMIAIMGGFGMILMGAIFDLIVAAIMKREPNISDAV